MTLLSAGSAHSPANPSTTSGVAKPVSLTARPKSVSSGTVFLDLAPHDGDENERGGDACRKHGAWGVLGA